MVKSLLDILRDVTLDPEQGAAYTADPHHYLAEQGYHDVADEDLREAFSLVADTLPPQHAQEVYTSHVAPSLHDSLQPVPTHEEHDPGTVYGHTGDDFDLDLDDALNTKVVDPDPHDVDPLHHDHGAQTDHGDHGAKDLGAQDHADDQDHDDQDIGFGHGADHDFDDAHGMVSMDDLDDDDLADDHTVDDHDTGLGHDLHVDVNPFDESHDPLDDAHGMVSMDDLHHDQADVHHADDQHDTHDHHDVDDVDLGFF